jgi:hypothetical protein
MKTFAKILFGGFWLLAMGLSSAQADTVDWINHFDLLSGNPSNLTLTTNSTSSGIGGGLTGVVVKSRTVGDVFPDGGNKVVHMALNLPPQPAGIAIRGVRICYESTSIATYVTQTRIAEVQNPPSIAAVKMDDVTDLNLPGANCVTVSGPGSNIAVGNGPLLLSLRFNFGSINDAIVIRGLGIILG